MSKPPMTAMEAAMNDYRNNPRFRALVTAVSAEVMQDIPVELSRAMADARLINHINDIALKTAALMLTRIYEDDYELREQKVMAEQYRKIAEDALFLAPPIFVRGLGES